MLLGLEIAAHHATAVLADAAGVAQANLREEFAPHVPPATRWLGAMELCRDLLRQSGHEISAISRMGIAFDSPVGPNTIVLKNPVRPGWEGYDLSRGIREHLGVQNVVATSRVNAEALGETQFGALRGQNDWMYLHLGRGLESSLCLNGKLRVGSGAAGDIGSFIIERDGSIDPFGGRGTLRAYCGGDGFESRARSYGMTFTKASEVWNIAPSNFAAQSLIDDFISRLAQALAGVVTLLEPAHICFGGAFGSAIWPHVRDPLASTLRDMLPLRSAPISFLPSQLADDAAPLGAVALALNATFES